MGNLYNLARMTTATIGTGTITLAAAAPSFLTFAQAGAQDGDEISYAIEVGASEREMGRGIYNAAAQTLTRNVLRSTNGNNPIVLDGKAQVFITPSAEDLVAPKTSVYGRYNGQWVPVPIVADVMPTNPAPNAVWFDSTRGGTFLWYTDSNGSHWVEIISQSGMSLSWIDTYVNSAINSALSSVDAAFDATNALVATANATANAANNTANDAANMVATTALRLTGHQTTTGGFAFTAHNVGSFPASFQPNPMNGNYQYGINDGAFTLTAMSVDSAIDLLIVNGASAGAISFAGFIVGPVIGDPLTTISGDRFLISLRRIGIATYLIKALQ